MKQFRRHTFVGWQNVILCEHSVGRKMKNIQINLKELENKIDAEKLAIADANHNIPPSDSKTPGASESKIRMISSESLMETVSKINKSGS